MGKGEKQQLSGGGGYHSCSSGLKGVAQPSPEKSYFEHAYEGRTWLRRGGLPAHTAPYTQVTTTPLYVPPNPVLVNVEIQHGTGSRGTLATLWSRVRYSG